MAGNEVAVLEASSDLAKWTAIAVIQHTPWVFSDPESAGAPFSFYRFGVSPLTSTNDWKNLVRFLSDELPLDPFVLYQDRSLGWVKFTILADEPSRVFYQDSRKYLFHYDFAVQRLPSFEALSPERFREVSAHPSNQRVILGSVLFPPGAAFNEYGVQFVGLEPYPRETIARLFELVKSTVAAAPNVKAYYMPTVEQLKAAEADQAYFASKSIQLSSPERWFKPRTVDCYSYGWALGRMKFIPGSEIASSYADGRLRPEDVLLTDGVPAEVPFVAGIVTLAPSTPNSHVAILARSYGVPFVYLVEPGERDRVRRLVGKEVMLRAGSREGRDEVKLLDLEGVLEPAMKAELLALKQPARIEITPKARYGALSAPTQNLTPSDIRYFGGKAANFGLLRRTIPEHSPEAIAISFDLWDDFLTQTLPSGKTLRDEIDARLTGYRYPPDFLAVRASLVEVRDLITRVARFTPEQRNAIIVALAGFDRLRQIRFRSSTNVEDAEKFTGAGLYDSYGGCLADDIDDDTIGPCRCDPDESNERGVFRAIQRVYASFYNENAFLERLRFGLDESQLGMALLVHHSFPDEIKLANGVATVRAGSFFSDYVFSADLVTQLGPLSVANPGDTARPETVQVGQSRAGTNFWFEVKERSSLLPLGGTVLTWPEDYQTLVVLLTAVARAYAGAVPGKTQFVLDFEYKKIQPGRLEIKQVRKIPMPKAATGLGPFLVPESATFCVSQNEGPPWTPEQIFVVHRLKSKWELRTQNMRLDERNLTSTIYSNVEVEYREGATLEHLAGSPSSWVGAQHSGLDDSWIVRGGMSARRFALRAWRWPLDLPADNPLLTLGDLDLRFEVSDPNATVDASNESVQLIPAPVIAPDQPFDSIVVSTNGVSVRIGLYRRKDPFNRDRPTFAQFQETRIEGLTRLPIILRGYYSQTRWFTPGAHNSWDDLLFEPGLEPALSSDTARELEQANIHLIRVYDPVEIVVDWYQPRYRISLLGFDGSARDPAEASGMSGPLR
ncbi:MAG: hypothetical protein HYY24_28195 [Verrucomicrobia bacterium]|nr:hypothetical protein [Verrucomicrobiota bacterium]